MGYNNMRHMRYILTATILTLFFSSFENRRKRGKILIFIFFGLTIFLNAKSQSVNQRFRPISQEDYKQYFPIESQIALFTPTTDYVCILPTNEMDSILQIEVNEFYKGTFIQNYPTVPYQITKVISDKEALNEDLSNVNIHAFGTLEGNLWIAQFMEKAKDFPIKITGDSIVADRIYRGNDYVVTALWYNPDNFKHSVTLYIPQNLKCAKSAIRRNTFQYTIWQKGDKVIDSYYHLRDGCWHFSSIKDSLLIFRDVNHLMVDNLEKIDRNNYRFPTIEQVLTCPIEENDIPFEPIKISEINKDFSDITDMEWLRPIANKYKIIAVGESHHLKYNKYILKRILFATNTFDYFPLLVLELPYSYAGYFNYYLSLKDDKIAKLFCDSVLTKIYQPDLPMISVIRDWNKMHPEKKIQIGCSDLEQDFLKTIKQSLNPYLMKINPEADISYNIEDSLKGYLVRSKELIELAKKKNIIGDYPFQTPLYMESVFENLKSSIPIKLVRKNFTDHTLRFQVMVRNVTDVRFLGKQIVEGKSLFYGGTEHFRILNDGTDKKVCGTEGYYLAHTFEATKDQVYAISMNTLAISIEDSIQRIAPALKFSPETNLINLYKARKIKLNEPVLGPFTNEFDRYIYKLSYKYPGFAVRIKSIKLQDVLNRYEGFGRFMLYQSLKLYSDFNATIMIPYSPVGD